MKFSILAIATFIAPLVAMAAPTDKPKFDGNSKCEIHGFKYNPPQIVNCCLKNMGGADQQPKFIKCTLPIGREGYMRKCVKDLGFATVVDCVYYNYDE
ncbi:hypothetical protein FBU30_009866 [Linnemannia zychae]|nr:hypothetical protein FBU30_009866 [Linnemannia zychae]